MSYVRCKKVVAKVSIPSDGKGVRGIILKFSALRRCVGCSPFFNTVVKEITKEVTNSTFALSKATCRLRGGSKRRRLRKNSNNFRRIV